MCQEIFLDLRVDNTPYQDFKPLVSHIVVQLYFLYCLISLCYAAC